MMTTTSAAAAFREGFLLTTPRAFSWTSGGLYFVDYVRVSERVYDLAYTGELTAARAAWLAEFDDAVGRAS